MHVFKKLEGQALAVHSVRKPLRVAKLHGTFTNGQCGDIEGLLIRERVRIEVINLLDEIGVDKGTIGGDADYRINLVGESTMVKATQDIVLIWVDIHGDLFVLANTSEPPRVVWCGEIDWETRGLRATYDVLENRRTIKIVEGLES
jgi:hypothetical protein